jgi:RHS repeat-associated protein
MPAPVTQISYRYDGDGNLCKATDTCLFNTTNEEVKLDTANITYDPKGNLLDDGTYSYMYDEGNRKTAATSDAGMALARVYEYDALGRRVRKIANPAGTPSTTVYFYDGPRIIEEQNSLGVTSATYVYGNYVDEVLTMDVGGNTYYYHQNALWSVEAITDSTATPVERYAYNGYGLVSVTNGTGAPVPPNAWGTPHSAIGNPYIFTGRELDEETGLYFYRARYYDPVKDRFHQRDPLDYVDGMNLYEYVRDNPVNNLDPTGRTCCVKDIVLKTEGNTNFKFLKENEQIDTGDLNRLGPWNDEKTGGVSNVQQVHIILGDRVQGADSADRKIVREWKATVKAGNETFTAPEGRGTSTKAAGTLRGSVTGHRTTRSTDPINSCSLWRMHQDRPN